MKDFNKMLLFGGVVRDPEAKGNNSVAITSLAYKTWNGKEEETNYVELAFFGRNKDYALEHIRKGDRLFVEAELKFHQWESKDGKKMSKHNLSVVTVNRVGFPEKKETSQNSGNSGDIYPQQDVDFP